VNLSGSSSKDAGVPGFFGDFTHIVTSYPLPIQWRKVGNMSNLAFDDQLCNKCEHVRETIINDTQ